MTLGIRKLIVLGTIASIFLLANALIVTAWLQDQGVIDWASYVRQEFLTGTAITIIVVLLILLVSPTRHHWIRSCQVCDRSILGGAKYCSECGSRV